MNDQKYEAIKLSPKIIRELEAIRKEIGASTKNMAILHLIKFYRAIK